MAEGRLRRGCSYKKTTWVVCSINIVIALYVLRSLYSSLYIYSGNVSRNSKSLFFCPQSNSTFWACFYGFWNTHLSVLGIFWESQFQNLFLFNAGNSRIILFWVRNFSSNRVWGFCEKLVRNPVPIFFMFNAGLRKRSNFGNPTW